MFTFNFKLPISIMMFFFILKARNVSATIEIVSQSSNFTFATNYTNLTLRAEFEDIYSSCYWYSKDLSVTRVEIFTLFIGCANRTAPKAYLTCLNSSRIIRSILQITEPVTTDLNITIFCNEEIIAVAPYIFVRDCIAPPQYIVHSNKSVYNSLGRISCPENTVFFDKNGSKANSVQTVCLSNATWSVPKELSCFPDPTPIIPGKLEGIQGNTLRVSCDYENLPTKQTTIFYFNNSEYRLEKGLPFIISPLRISDNNKTISCRSVTPGGSELVSNLSLSPVRTIRVLHPAYIQPATGCHWVKNYQQSCRIYFFSNPTSTFRNLTKNGRPVEVRLIVTNASKAGHVINFEKDNVTEDDAGSYDLIVHNSLFGVQNVSFEVSVYSAFPIHDQMRIESNELLDCVPVFVPIIIGVVFICASLIAVLVAWLCRMKRKTKKIPLQNMDGISLSRERIYENPLEIIPQEKQIHKAEPKMRKNELYELERSTTEQHRENGIRI